MNPVEMDRWDVNPAAAREIQQRLRSEVLALDRFEAVKHVAGADVSFGAESTVARAAVAVLSFPGLELVEYSVAELETGFPYVPGLLSFREMPPVLAALRRLGQAPHMMLCDGHGYAHPRRLGLACHMGVVTGIPTIGVAKTRLIGAHAPLGWTRGARQQLMDGDEVIGMVLRTRTGVKPVYVSVGHKVSLSSAVEYVLRCTPRYRLPETTRWAHRLACARDCPRH